MAATFVPYNAILSVSNVTVVKALVILPINIDVSTRPASVQNIANNLAGSDLGLRSPYLESNGFR